MSTAALIGEDLAQSSFNELDKQHYRAMWEKFLCSVQHSTPHLYLPRRLADALGSSMISDIMRRFR
jgi:hypothetical protein